jgi:hypothetical protein
VIEPSPERADRRCRGARSIDAAGPAMRRAALLLTLVAAGLGAACSNASVAGDETGLAPLVGEWRGVLLSQGGELPFRLRVGAEGSAPPAVVINADDERPLASITRQGAASYTLRFFDDDDSELVAKMSPGGETLSGYWRLAYSPAKPPDVPFEGVTQMPFSATKDDARRFQRNDPTLETASAAAIAALPELDGSWDATVNGAQTGELMSVTFRQDGEHIVGELIHGAPPFEGIYRNGLLRLSLFDGYRALLLHARATPDGTLEGTLWMADRGKARWSARPVEGPPAGVAR